MRNLGAWYVPFLMDSINRKCAHVGKIILFNNESACALQYHFPAYRIHYMRDLFFSTARRLSLLRYVLFIYCIYTCCAMGISFAMERVNFRMFACCISLTLSTNLAFLVWQYYNFPFLFSDCFQFLILSKRVHRYLIHPPRNVIRRLMPIFAGVFLTTTNLRCGFSSHWCR